MSVDATDSFEALLAATASGLQELPAGAQHVRLVAATVAGNNARIAAAATALRAMEDHPGSFDPWCRTFAQHADGP